MLGMFGLDIGRITTRTKQKSFENLWLDRKKNTFWWASGAEQIISIEAIVRSQGLPQGPLSTSCFSRPDKSGPWREVQHKLVPGTHTHIHTLVHLAHLFYRDRSRFNTEKHLKTSMKTLPWNIWYYWTWKERRWRSSIWGFHLLSTNILLWQVHQMFFFVWYQSSENYSLQQVKHATESEYFLKHRL